MGQDYVPDLVSHLGPKALSQLWDPDPAKDNLDVDSRHWIGREIQYDYLGKQVKDRIKELLTMRDTAMKQAEVVAERLAYDDEWGAQLATCRQPGSRTEGLEIENAIGHGLELTGSMW